MRIKSLTLSGLCLLSAVLAGCGRGDGDQNRRAADETPVLNLLIWSDYLASDTLSNFEKQTGIRVQVSFFDTNEMLETRLLAGHSGFDVVVPSADYFEHQIRSNVYLDLDKKLLPNFRFQDENLLRQVARYDPGNRHGAIYTWATNGIGYNVKLVNVAMSDAPVDSWHLLFDPTSAAQLSRCGISLLDSPVDVTRAVLSYLGRDPNSQSDADLADVAAALKKIRPYVRTITSSSYIEGLANGDLCVVLGYSGDILQAQARAEEVANKIEIRYSIPKEGTVSSFDMLAIPKDAPHPLAAHLFIDYMMSATVMAEISNQKHFANAVPSAMPLLNPKVRNDPGIFPPDSVRQRITPLAPDSPEHTRAMTSMWEHFKANE